MESKLDVGCAQNAVNTESSTCAQVHSHRVANDILPTYLASLCKLVQHLTISLTLF